MGTKILCYRYQKPYAINLAIIISIFKQPAQVLPFQCISIQYISFFF